MSVLEKGILSIQRNFQWFNMPTNYTGKWPSTGFSLSYITGFILFCEPYQHLRKKPRSQIPASPLASFSVCAFCSSYLSSSTTTELCSADSLRNSNQKRLHNFAMTHPACNAALQGNNTEKGWTTVGSVFKASVQKQHKMPVLVMIISSYTENHDTGEYWKCFSFIIFVCFGVLCSVCVCVYTCTQCTHVHMCMCTCSHIQYLDPPTRLPVFYKTVFFSLLVTVHNREINNKYYYSVASAS